jgi:pimeloyl-ACP methyl ester carboxylesterase
MAHQDVLFLPGFMCDERLFGPQVLALKGAGFVCHTGAYGESASIERMARHALREAPAKVALVGLSMGAIVALEIWRQFPERVTHMALLNTTARADAAGPARKAQLRQVVEGGLTDVLRKELAPKYFAQGDESGRLSDLIEAMGQRLGRQAFVHQSVALMTRPSLLDLLPSISCPVLVIAGDLDEICPLSRQEEMAAAIPMSELCIISPSGHISTLEQPDKVNAALLRLLSNSLAQPATVCAAAINS